MGRVKGEVKTYQLSYVQKQSAVVGLAELVSSQERDAYGLWTMKPVPALSLPVGGTPTRPGAVQLVSTDEATLLRAAARLEAAVRASIDESR